MVHARHPVQGSKKGSAMEIIFYRYGSICDILGYGDFLMTNFQSELTDYFTIGVALEAYSSMDELVDKCAYYLAHDEERKQIVKNGYDEVPACHAYPHRIRKMLKTPIPIG